MHEDRTKIIHHISRLEGQLASIKKQLQEEDPDCEQASTTLLSASRSFAGLREEFVRTFLNQHFITNKKDRDSDMYQKLVSLIKG